MTQIAVTTRNYPALLSEARRALAEVSTLPDIAKLIDHAEVIRVAARAAGLSTAAQNDWTRYKVDCERAAAAAIERMRAAGELASHGGDRSSSEARNLPSLGTLGVDNRRAAEWETMASITAERMDEEFAAATKAGRQVSEAALLRVARTIERGTVVTPPLPEGVYDVIYADPPWQYDNSGGLPGQAVNHYHTMHMSEIAALPIPAASDAALFLWVTNPMLREGLDLAEAWGFTYKSNIVWIKTELTRPGVGFYVRGRHELLFICTKGSFVPDQTGRTPISSVLQAAVQEHSRKPEEAYTLIEQIYPGGKYLELFARNDRPGWTSWGNEVHP